MLRGSAGMVKANSSSVRPVSNFSASSAFSAPFRMVQRSNTMPEGIRSGSATSRTETSFSSGREVSPAGAVTSTPSTYTNAPETFSA